MHVGLQFNGKPRPLKSLPATASLSTDNLSTWRRYVAADLSLVDLARWGHQQPDMPWEVVRDSDANAKAGPCAAVPA